MQPSQRFANQRFYSDDSANPQASGKVAPRLERRHLRAGAAARLRAARLLAHDAVAHHREVGLGAILQPALEDVVGLARCAVLDADQLPAVGAQPVQEAPRERAGALAFLRVELLAFD